MAMTATLGLKIRETPLAVPTANVLVASHQRLLPKPWDSTEFAVHCYSQITIGHTRRSSNFFFQPFDYAEHPSTRSAHHYLLDFANFERPLFGGRLSE